MRIISGKKRGHRLKTPDGGDIRPTKDQVREGLFGILTGGRYNLPLAELIVADVFAGTGALGLEAWSQGARQVVFIEKNSTALAALDANINAVEAEAETIVIRGDATSRLVWPTPPANLLFFDPPWQYQDADPDLAHIALVNLIHLEAIAEGAIISVEHDRRRPAVFPDHIEVLETREWGKTACTLGRYHR
jgi:16S rRNA (guanine966-N2)-methyltransferase